MIGLYAAYRAKTQEVDLAYAMVGVYVNNYSLCEPRSHVTVIYARTSSHAEKHLIAKQILAAYSDLTAVVSGVELFNSPSMGKKTFALVLTLDCPELQEVHTILCDTGLKHSYPVYSPHLSLGYGLINTTALTLAKQCKDVTIGRTIKLNCPYVEMLNETWN